MSIKKFGAVVLFLSVWVKSYSQEWPAFPGFDYSHSSLALIDQESFMVLAGAAVTSYVLSEFVLKDVENVHHYQVRGGIVGTVGGIVVLENFGIEKRLSHWYGLGLEINNQQWFYDGEIGAGMGFNTYYRWHLFGRKQLSPYIEYGAGLFLGFSKFPPGGTSFTFNLTTQLGVEYTLENKNKIRLGYGHLHQSNNGLLSPNPGEDGNGFNICYLWFWE